MGGIVQNIFITVPAHLTNHIFTVFLMKKKNRNFLTPADKQNLFTMDHHPIWYRLAAKNKPGQFYYYVPVDDINKGAGSLTCDAEFNLKHSMLLDYNHYNHYEYEFILYTV